MTFLNVGSSQVPFLFVNHDFLEKIPELFIYLFLIQSSSPRRIALQRLESPRYPAILSRFGLWKEGVRDGFILWVPNKIKIKK